MRDERGGWVRASRWKERERMKEQARVRAREMERQKGKQDLYTN